MAKLQKISDFTIFSPEFEALLFARNGVVFAIDEYDIDFVYHFGYEVTCDHNWGEGDSNAYTDIESDVNSLVECSAEQLQDIIDGTKPKHIRECTMEWEEYQDELRLAARKKMLSGIMSKAWALVKNGLNDCIKSGLCAAWLETKIFLSGVVTFFKKNNEDEITTRRVARLSAHGIVGKSTANTTDIIRCIDLDKLATTGNAAASIISFHVWQIMGY